MTRPKLLAIGGAHIDRRGQVSGIYVPGASNPGTMSEDVGGGVFNAVRNAARRGVGVSLMSVRGADSAGENVARAIERAGLSLAGVVPPAIRGHQWTLLLGRAADGFMAVELPERDEAPFGIERAEHVADPANVGLDR